MKRDVLFFDAGGTLVRPARPVGEIYAEVGRTHGQAWDGARLHNAFKRSWQHLKKTPRASVPSNGDDREWWKKLVQLTLQDETVSSGFSFDAYFEELYWLFELAEYWTVFPEVVSTLTDLKERGYRLAVLSNWDRRLHSILKNTGLSDFFEQIIISTETGAEKPSEAIFQRALEIMKCSSANAWMIGDDPVNDGSGPEKAGWRSIVIKRPDETLAKVLQALQ